MNRVVKASLCLALTIAILGCSSTPPESGQPVLFVSIAPQAFLLEKIAGTDWNIQVLVAPGQNPHTYEPTPQQLTTLSQAKILYTIGMPFETQLVSRIQDTYPNLTLIDTSAGIQKRALEGEDHHDHGEEGHFHDDHLDPHIWLSPTLLKVQAQHLLNGLCQLHPEATAVYQSNYQSLINEIDLVEKEVQTQLAPFAGESFYVFHPSFAYFADAFGLHEEAIEVEGKSPTPKQMTDIINAMRTKGIRVLFIQPQFDRKSGESIAQAIGGTAVPLDPLAHDVLQTMRDAAQKIQEALQTKEANP
ncbi:MAG: zinc ABC transporter substrate-binding protein [bacterium]|jgi:zinc transport system substrate-binding protein|nr:zinc ABC transporter substrate-binding protein [bacterium]